MLSQYVKVTEEQTDGQTDDLSCQYRALRKGDTVVKDIKPQKSLGLF